MKYVFLFHLPGAAGNFVSKCLNLLDNAHCWVNRHTGSLSADIVEKLDMLSYQPVMHLQHKDRNWVNWEDSLQGLNHGNLPADAEISIDVDHPSYRYRTQDIVGKDDNKYVVYIDASECFEWCVLNALYKNSFLSVGWFKTAEQMRADPDILKISLQKIISSESEYLEEFKKICDYIGHELTAAERTAVGTLYNQWVKTQLRPEQFAEFKQQIGWQL